MWGALRCIMALAGRRYVKEGVVRACVLRCSLPLSHDGSHCPVPLYEQVTGYSLWVCTLALCSDVAHLLAGGTGGTFGFVRRHVRSGHHRSATCRGTSVAVALIGSVQCLAICPTFSQLLHDLVYTARSTRGPSRSRIYLVRRSSVGFNLGRGRAGRCL